jgi:hypothetical protein
MEIQIIILNPRVSGSHTRSATVISNTGETGAVTLHVLPDIRVWTVRGRTAICVQIALSRLFMETVSINYMLFSQNRCSNFRENDSFMFRGLISEARIFIRNY